MPAGTAHKVAGRLICSICLGKRRQLKQRKKDAAERRRRKKGEQVPKRDAFPQRLPGSFEGGKR